MVCQVVTNRYVRQQQQLSSLGISVDKIFIKYIRVEQMRYLSI